MRAHHRDVHKYRTLVAWQRAHRLAVLALRVTDAAYHPRARSLFDQMRRAGLSVEANIVEGYALGTAAQFRRHLRIATGSAAEFECFVRTAIEVGYLGQGPAGELSELCDGVLRALFGLLKRGIAHGIPS